MPSAVSSRIAIPALLLFAASSCREPAAVTSPKSRPNATFEDGRTASAEWRALNLKARLENDELDVENAKLAQDIAKIERRPYDSTQCELSVARLEADKTVADLDAKYRQRRALLMQSARIDPWLIASIRHLDNLQNELDRTADYCIAQIRAARSRAQLRVAQANYEASVQQQILAEIVWLNAELDRAKATDHVSKDAQIP